MVLIVWVWKGTRLLGIYLFDRLNVSKRYKRSKI